MSQLLTPKRDGRHLDTFTWFLISDGLGTPVTVCTPCLGMGVEDGYQVAQM